MYIFSAEYCQTHSDVSINNIATETLTFYSDTFRNSCILRMAREMKEDIWFSMGSASDHNIQYR